MSRWAQTLKDAHAARAYEQAAARIAGAFSRSFWFEEGSYLYDVIDGPEGADSSLRPNQLFAVSLGTDLLAPPQAKAVVDACSRELLTPVGLRTLPARDRRYAAMYTGGPGQRDAVYHQGTVWSWLLGPFALAHYRVYRDVEHATALLAGLEPHLGEACLGTVSEIFDGSPPHKPRGCFAQAWSVSETLRAWHALTRSQNPTRARVLEMVGG
jgi:glycogen debranching enzyme